MYDEGRTGVGRTSVVVSGWLSVELGERVAKCRGRVRLFAETTRRQLTTRNKNSCSAVCDDVTYRLSDRRCTSHVLLLTEPVDSDLKLLLRLAAVQLVIGRDWKVYVCTPPHCASPSPAAIHRQNKGRAP